MLLYEVNLHLDADLAGAFEPWLRAHMQEMLAFDGFTRAVRFELEPTPGTLHWTVHYHVRDRAALQAYLDQHAAAMRTDGARRFGGRFTADRRILHAREIIDRP